MKFHLLLWIWAGVCPCLVAQSADTVEAHHWLQEGHKFYREHKDYQAALKQYRKASEAFRLAGFEERYAYCVTRSGLSEYRSRRYQNALEWFRKGLSVYDSLYPEDHVRLIYPNTRIGTAYTALGNHYSALEHLQRAADLSIKFKGMEDAETGAALYNLGTALLNYGEYQEGMQVYQKALSIYLKSYPDGMHPRLSNLYVNMGIQYDKRGEAEKALEYYNKSNQIDSTLYGEDYYLLAYNYYNMAISLVNLKQFSSAQEYYQKTIALSQKNQIYLLWASAHYGLGNLAKIDQDYQTAEKLYLKAIQLFKRHLGPEHPDINHSYRGLAQLYQDQQAFSKAEEYLRECLSLLQINFGHTHPWIARTYQQLGGLYQAKKQFNKALEYYELAFEALLEETGEAGSKNHQDYSDQGIFMDLLRDFAGTYQAKYHWESRDPRDLELAFESFKKAIQVIDDVRRGYILDNSKVFLQDEAFTTYEKAIECGYDLYQISAEGRILDQIHQIIEKSKATVLAEAMQGNQLQSIKGVPDSVLNKEIQLKKRIGYLESTIQNVEAMAKDSLQKSLFNLHLQYDTLSEYLSAEYPDYYNLKYGVETITATQFQHLIEPETAVLNYFLGDRHWYVFAFNRNEQHLHRIDSSTASSLDLSAFRDLLTEGDAGEFADSPLPFILYRELVSKPLAKLTSAPGRLIIVPHGYLAHLPFGAFLTRDSGYLSPKYPYLVYDHPISYTPSLTLLHRQKPANGFSHDYLGYAPEYYSSGSDQLPPLPGTSDEVHQARDIFKGQVYIDSEATESLFKAPWGGSRILHLAMHALVDDQDPMNSRLMFSSDQDSLEDGALHAHEIYNLQISSELAVLSACNTGYGEIVRGEGVMNLSRAFQYAGSPNIIMSLWQASDNPTARIMKAFFEHLKTGEPKDIALQKAKIEYLEQADPFAAHPGQWATFILLGDPKPLNFDRSDWKWYLLLAILVALVLWFSFNPRKRSTQSST